MRKAVSLAKDSTWGKKLLDFWLVLFIIVGSEEI